MSDEMSDDARSLACPDFYGDLLQQEIWMAGFDECRRRATVMIENEVEHCAELRMDLESRISDLEALIEQERSVRIRVEQMYQALTESIETERRKAFEKAYLEGKK